jgi:hypothetical protein
MESHPGIVFRSGPAGRRAGLVGGPDVWEVVRAFPSTEGSAEMTPTLTDLSVEQVRTVMQYYADHRAEIDGWLRRVDEEAAQVEAAWRSEQDRGT